MDNQRLTKEQEELVLQNRPLVKYMMHKFHVPLDEREDVESIGYIELTKAARVYDPSRGNFSTIACKYLENAINLYYVSQQRRHSKSKEISLEEEIVPNDGGRPLRYMDAIASSDGNFAEILENKETFLKSLRVIFNLLDRKERFAMLGIMSGMHQYEIAEKMHISKAYVTYLLQNGRDKIKMGLIQEYEEKNMVYEKDDIYEIRGVSLNTQKFTQNMQRIIKEEETISDGDTGIRLTRSEEAVIIQFQVVPHDFFILAKLLDRMEELDVFFPAKVVQKINKSKNVTYISQIRRFISQHVATSFTLSEVHERFPNIPYNRMIAILLQLKKDGKLTSSKRGVYEVVHNHKSK